MEKRTDLSIREVISTNSQFLQAMQEDAQEIVAREKEKMLKQRLPLPLAYLDFKNLFRSFGTVCLHHRNQNRNFIIDNDNTPMIEQLYLYATGNPSFEGNLGKGIMLQGKYGCGKTLILETYSLLHNHVIRKYHLNYLLLTFIKSVELQEQILKQSASAFAKRPLIIDEFGRESKTVMDYGNISRPVSELLSLRNDAGTLTHGTTNFTLATLSSDEFYGGMIGDRLKAMFNFITLKGESR
ncbi:MAG: ATP-binding protein [Tannerella sp.]|jgi:DNA replication protein DnaC|nr:ATP-binding protein [Tannerella sp.]